MRRITTTEEPKDVLFTEIVNPSQVNGINLIKYWFEVSEKEQRKRFLKRIQDPNAPMEAQSKWTWNRTVAGTITRERKMQCLRLQIHRSPRGTWCKPTTKGGPD
jgi:polyphosphate kinase 2 PPK2